MDVEATEPQREPSQTVYLSNLNEKVRKDELRHCLYALCSQFGPILDIVATKTLKMRGQAFVVFKDISSASSAVHKLSGFPFFDKPMKAQYAESKSDIVARLDGTYSVDSKRREKEEKAARKAAKLAQAANPKKRRAVEDAEGEPTAKKPKEIELNPPHKILFVQQVPKNVQAAEITALFSKLPGFKDTKLPKPELAFVFYETEQQAALALTEYQNWKFTPEDRGLLINFAKQ
jgi:RNA recognition motif-containing protein